MQLLSPLRAHAGGLALESLHLAAGRDAAETVGCKESIQTHELKAISQSWVAAHTPVGGHDPKSSRRPDFSAQWRTRGAPPLLQTVIIVKYVASLVAGGALQAQRLVNSAAATRRFDCDKTGVAKQSRHPPARACIAGTLAALPEAVAHPTSPHLRSRI